VEAAAAGHTASQDLLEQAGGDLSLLALQVLGQLRIQGPVILGGGLGMNVAPLQDAFRRHLAQAGVTDVRVLDQEPVFGVLQLLAEQA
jgi:hypothetical protein